jgi:hypothetical protein
MGTRGYNSQNEEEEEEQQQVRASVTPKAYIGEV